mmetsp:Transcript_120719/g.313430  ORF Transcript_120719/g.313430 Transcript_120719/m.313430 type:complete len:272 (+) Transcript_120719:508-1323(+)
MCLESGVLPRCIIKPIAAFNLCLASSYCSKIPGWRSPAKFNSNSEVSVLLYFRQAARTMSLQRKGLFLEFHVFLFLTSCESARSGASVSMVIAHVSSSASAGTRALPGNAWNLASSPSGRYRASSCFAGTEGGKSLAILSHCFLDITWSNGLLLMQARMCSNANKTSGRMIAPACPKSSACKQIKIAWRTFLWAFPRNACIAVSVITAPAPSRRLCFTLGFAKHAAPRNSSLHKVRLLPSRRACLALETNSVANSAGRSLAWNLHLSSWKR